MTGLGEKVALIALADETGGTGSRDGTNRR